MAIFPGSAIPSAVSAYDIDNSLRFNQADSGVLYKTPAVAGNRRTFTLSFWFKFCPNADDDDFFMFSAGTGNSPANYAYLEIYLQKLYFRNATGGSTYSINIYSTTATISIYSNMIPSISCYGYARCANTISIQFR